MERILMRTKFGRFAFSLIEILVVCALIAVLLVTAVPAVSSLMRASELQRGGMMVADAVGRARQIASSLRVSTELRFVEIPSDTNRRWQAVQIWAANPRGGILEPATRLQRLPQSVSLAPGLSPLLQSGDAQGSMDVSGGTGTCPYAGLRFRPDGSLEQPLGSEENFVTLVASPLAGTSEAPANFFAIQINAYTGKATVYQP